jgi:hypothetical protein
VREGPAEPKSSVLAERAAQLPQPHWLAQVGEARNAFGEDFVYPDGVLVAAARRFRSAVSRRRVAYDVLEVQQGDAVRSSNACRP